VEKQKKHPHGCFFLVLKGLIRAPMGSGYVNNTSYASKKMSSCALRVLAGTSEVAA